MKKEDLYFNKTELEATKKGLRSTSVDGKKFLNSWTNNSTITVGILKEGLELIKGEASGRHIGVFPQRNRGCILVLGGPHSFPHGTKTVKISSSYSFSGSQIFDAMALDKGAKTAIPFEVKEFDDGGQYIELKRAGCMVNFWETL